MAFESLLFDPVRDWIKDKRKSNVSWEEIESGLNDLSYLLCSMEKFSNWPHMSEEDWLQIVEQQRISEETTEKLLSQVKSATIHDEHEENVVEDIPRGNNSAWQTYRRKLKAKGFHDSSIDEIEKTTYKILKRLSLDTTEISPRKGLVIGNVQSGKTANMAALMAMAADWGWNMFIVLSGTIDNLREQTQKRLFGDLHDPICKLQWISLDKLRPNMITGQRAQDMSFESNQRYMNVCLKNSTRLKNLIKWLQEDKNSQEKMRVLLIDDEADQAGINTAKIDSQTRKTINSLLCALVNGNNEKNESIDTKFKAMNYIGYTATPYANVLNESSRESLYPRNFITSLQVSNEYFGPQQIFGCDETDEYEGLDIIREISQEDLGKIVNIHSGNSNDIPDSLADSICWFVCCVACSRFWGRKSPVSLLVHTSQRTDHHSHIAYSIESWIKSNKRIMVTRCKAVWKNETEKFSLENFHDQYPNYGETNVRDYPKFGDIEPLIKELLNKELSSIPLGEDSKPEYHKGIHLCVDNCQNNGKRDGMFLRLLYPEEKLDFAPAFIVVGGATLSRGLTIEGLVSTYFLRSVKQSDTLMQMGRWFGYRKGYELLPRIWMTDRTVKQFEFLSSLDYKLRLEISRMERLGITPDKYGPRVKNSPQVSFIRITAANRMQQAFPTDYSGSTSQTYVFDNNRDIILHNQETTRTFLTKLKAPEPHKACNKHAVSSHIWRNVDFADVREYLTAFKYSERQGAFNDIEHMMRWFDAVVKSGSMKKWNVVLAGKKSLSSRDAWYVTDTLFVNKISRAQKKRKDDGVINIGTLRDPHDIIDDIDLENASKEVAEKIKNFQSKYALSIRNEAGLGNIPQLIIYVIDKNSKSNSKTRDDLNAKEDIIGICINVPGDNDGSGMAQEVAIPISNDTFNYIEDINGTDED